VLNRCAAARRSCRGKTPDELPCADRMDLAAESLLILLLICNDRNRT